MTPKKNGGMYGRLIFQKQINPVPETHITPPVADQVSLWGTGVSAPRTGCRNNNAFLAIRSVTHPQPTPSQNKKHTIAFVIPGSDPGIQVMLQIKMSLWNNGDHPAPVILVFRNQPILTHKI